MPPWTDVSSFEAIDSRSSSGADSCSTIFPSRSPKRPEQTTHMPVSCSPTRSTELSRGASPEPKHRPTSGIVILELRRRRRVREGGQSTRQSLSGAAPSSSGRSCGSTNARIAGAQALSSQRGSSSVPLAALVCVQPLSAFGARVRDARNDFQSTVLPLLLTTGTWTAVPLTGRDGIAGVPIESGKLRPGDQGRRGAPRACPQRTLV